MNPNLIVIDIEASSGNGEDNHLICDEAYFESVVLGVFDGLGGRSAGFDGITGGRIASRQATQTTERVLKQWNGRLNQDSAIEVQSAICKSLKLQAESKMGKSRLSGTLTGKRLCTTIALASIPKKLAEGNGSCEISLAWMGDSRVYFLSSQKGLQQLTKDDLEIEKDAFQIIREDPRMSQYLTADVSDDWQIHFTSETIEEKGCILVCTDGCFQYLPAPWDFETLLLETLTGANTLKDWQSLLAQKYEEIKQDDISLILYPIGFTDFSALLQDYQTRLKYILAHYRTDARNVSLNDLWESYRSDYEARLPKDLKPLEIEKVDTRASSFSESVDDQSETQSLFSDPNGESIDAQPEKDIQQEFSSNASSADEIHSNPISLENLKNESHSIDAGLTIVRVEKVSQLFDQAEKTKNVSQMRSVILECQQILNGNSNNLKIQFIQGKAHLFLNEVEDAINCFESIINNQNRDCYQDYLSLIAEAFYKIQDYSNSSFYFLRLKSISCHQPYKVFKDDQLDFYADSLFRTGNFQDALKVCDAILYRNSNIPLANYLKGMIYHKSGNLYQASRFLWESLEFYKQDFSRTGSESSLKAIEIVGGEYNQVLSKLNNQRPYSGGGY